MDRRTFCTSLAFAPAPRILANELESSQKRGFPESDYTPFGYLDNPWHTWELNRSGILRSLPGIGFALYYPAGPGGYFDFSHNEIYEAQLSLAFQIGARRIALPEEFAVVNLRAPHHSNNLLIYEFDVEQIQVRCSFLQINEHVIAAEVSCSGSNKLKIPVRVLARHTYKLGGATWWGRDGLAGDLHASSSALTIRSFAAGTVFALAADRPTEERFLAVGVGRPEEWLNAASKSEERTSYYPEPLSGALRYAFELTSRANVTLRIALARGPNTQTALKRVHAALPSVPAVISHKHWADDAFWSAAPMLTGDWPKHWRHGWVYDFETLRMMVRRPIGLYNHPWDAMQIQAPRNVLAETSIDMWALSYADPDSAKAVFAGQFLDALEPNIPCMRENGVMNMIAVDGSACGTSISWCYPYFCAASIYDRTQDRSWLRTIYPGLAALLEWTIRNRTDTEGFIIGKCSWETGMDASKRFLIEQPTGGELVDFLRLVELQAAAAHAAATLERFRRILGLASDSRLAQAVRVYTAKTQQLWQNDWFHDYDTRRKQFVTNTERDPSQAAPAFCGIATDEQKRRMLPTLRRMLEQSRTRRSGTKDWEDQLAWSSFVLPYLESIWAMGDYSLAAKTVEMIAERIYPSMDRRTLGEHAGWPGVSCEIWGAQGAFGGEGYGWGAVLPAHIIRNILGLRETANPRMLDIASNFPSSLAGRGKQYGITRFRYGATELSLTVKFIDDQRVVISGECSGEQSVVSVSDGRSEIGFEKKGKGWQFQAANHTRYRVTLR